MLQNDKKAAFVALGTFLAQFSEENCQKNPTVLHNDLFYDDFSNLIQLSQSHNGWFTPQNIFFAIQSWANALTENNLNQWLSGYSFENISQKNVGIILAGNIPLVGFHDFVCVVISGHRVLVKSSSNDQHLLPFLSKYLIAVDPRLSDFIEFVDGKMLNFDAVIATGSNNTARYFDYYFKSKPTIIRKNRNSIAVLNGKETKMQLKALGEDIFRYFGLGCRNVSKLFVPRNYDFTAFFEAIFEFQDCVFYEKYANNYDYNKAVFLMSNFKLLDNGFLTLKEDLSHASPISSVFYEFYDDLNLLIQRLQTEKDHIQCIVTALEIENKVDFGATQKPDLWDYADEVDTLSFLINLKP